MTRGLATSSAFRHAVTARPQATMASAVPRRRIRGMLSILALEGQVHSEDHPTEHRNRAIVRPIEERCRGAANGVEELDFGILTRISLQLPDREIAARNADSRRGDACQ